MSVLLDTEEVTLAPASLAIFVATERGIERAPVKQRLLPANLPPADFMAVFITVFMAAAFAFAFGFALALAFATAPGFRVTLDLPV
mmetsp:Transcript_41255/g.84919  ORF Transcript_41255/g.84919 Transcript_41255/m.84919 type:complete len:86 (+) Transcript_41255:202-459(+)